MVRRLLSDPDGFYATKATENGLRREAGLLLVIGALGAAGLAWLGQMFLSEVPGDRSLMRIHFIGHALAVFVGPLVLWVVYTGCTYVVSWMLNTRGPISRLFKISAWSFVPLAGANAVFSVAVFWAYRDEDVPAEVPGVRVADKVEYLFGLANGEPAMILAWLVTGLAVVYTGYLLSFGLVHARGVSREGARQAAAVPVVLHLGFVAYTLLTQTGVI